MRPNRSRVLAGATLLLLAIGSGAISKHAALSPATSLVYPSQTPGMLISIQRRFLYFPDRQFVAGPADYGFAHENVTLRTEDGLAIHAWWLPVERATTTVLFFHGNAGNVSYWIEAATMFRDLGWNTLLLDYRGYGRSEGEPTEDGTYLDARAAWNYLIDARGIQPSNIVVVGRSLGGGIATWLAEREPVSGLVLESTFTSVADVVAATVPIPGIGSVVSLGYPSLGRMPRIVAPLLVLHGREDELIPFAQGRQLYEAAPGPKRFVELKGGHNNAFAISRNVYRDALANFVASLRPA